MKKIDTWPINNWIKPHPKSDTVFFLRQDENTRHLFLRYGSKENYINKLTPVFGKDAPLEATFVKVEGTQFIIFWVDNNRLRLPAKFILLYRPPTKTRRSNTRRSKMVEVTSKGLSVLPIFPLEQKEWNAIEYLAVLPKKPEELSVYKKEFKPPFDLKGLFNKISLQ